MPLRGLIFDADDQPMSPSFAYGRGGRFYRYYVSAPLQQGRRVQTRPDAVHRLAAGEIEEIVRRILAEALGDRPMAELLKPVARIGVEAERLRTWLRLEDARMLPGIDVDVRDPALGVLTAEIRCRLRGGRTWITTPPSSTDRVRLDPTLVRGLQSAHRLAAYWAGGPLTEDSHLVTSAPRPTLTIGCSVGWRSWRQIFSGRF